MLVLGTQTTSVTKLTASHIRNQSSHAAVIAKAMLACRCDVPHNHALKSCCMASSTYRHIKHDQQTLAVSLSLTHAGVGNSNQQGCVRRAAQMFAFPVPGMIVQAPLLCNLNCKQPHFTLCHDLQRRFADLLQVCYEFVIKAKIQKPGKNMNTY